MAEEILDAYKTRVEALTLKPSSGGVFEVKLNENLIFSRKELNRYPNEGEVLEKVKAMVKS